MKITRKSAKSAVSSTSNEALPSREASEIAAGIWTTPACANKQLDVELATEFAKVLDTYIKELDACYAARIDVITAELASGFYQHNVNELASELGMDVCFTREDSKKGFRTFHKAAGVFEDARAAIAENRARKDEPANKRPTVGELRDALSKAEATFKMYETSAQFELPPPTECLHATTKYHVDAGFGNNSWQEFSRSSWESIEGSLEKTWNPKSGLQP